MEKVMGQQMPENQLNQPEGDVGDEIAGDDEEELGYFELEEAHMQRHQRYIQVE